MKNLLLGLNDKWYCVFDASADAIKVHATDEALEIFSFLSDFLVFLDAEVSNFSDEGWVSEVSSSIALFCESVVSWSFLKEEDSVTRRWFDLRLEVFDSWLEEGRRKLHWC